ncbi:MAG: hypothetical protein ACLQVI_32360, partial [Polyangiaceae bacterium]
MLRGRIARLTLGMTLAAWASAGALDTACTSSSASTSQGTVYPAPPNQGQINDGNGHVLKTLGTVTDPGAGGFLMSISGEVNALTSYPYPPFDVSQTWMVDGWNWKIDKYIVVLQKVTLSSDPGKGGVNTNGSPINQQLTGSPVAEVTGPWVIDLHKGGPLDGKGGGGEEALPFAVMTNQNLNGGASFDPSTTYAFSFSTIGAPGDGTAINVNLDQTEEADYQYMVKGDAEGHPYSVYYYGTATWAGDASGAPSGFAQCQQTCPNSGSSADGGVEEGGTSSCPAPYDFTKLPPTINFQLGFSTPTNYVNCVNYTVSEQENQTVLGVQTSTSQSTINQVTVHMDHPFWESFQEDTPVHWDQIAAQYIGVTSPVAHIDDLKGVPFSPFTDKNGNVMPWRDCEPTYYSPPGNGAMSFSTLSVAQNPNGVCTGNTPADDTTSNCPAIRDYYDFIRYTQSTQGHLNSQGL